MLQTDFLFLRLKASLKASRDLSFFLCWLEWLWVRLIAELCPYCQQDLPLLYPSRPKQMRVRKWKTEGTSGNL